MMFYSVYYLEPLFIIILLMLGYQGEFLTVFKTMTIKIRINITETFN